WQSSCHGPVAPGAERSGAAGQVGAGQSRRSGASGVPVLTALQAAGAPGAEHLGGNARNAVVDLGAVGGVQSVHLRLPCGRCTSTVGLQWAGKLLAVPVR